MFSAEQRKVSQLIHSPSLFVQFFLVLGAEFGFPEINNNLVNYAGELGRWAMVLTHLCSGVFADVERFVCGIGTGWFAQSAFDNFFSVHRQREKTAFAKFRKRQHAYTGKKEYKPQERPKKVAHKWKW